MFELWDAELGISLGSFQSEAEAPGGSPETLRAIGRQSRARLIQDQRAVVATGDALVDRAFSRA